MRILWLKTELLHPVDKGGKIRTYQMLKELKRDHEITYLTLDDGSAGADARKLASEYCHELDCIRHEQREKFSAGFYFDLATNLSSSLPYAVKKYESNAMREEISRLARQKKFDVIVCDFLAPAVNLPAHVDCPVVLFQHNVEAIIWKRHYEVQTNPLKKSYLHRQWRKMERIEQTICQRVDAVVAVSSEDRETLEREYNLEKVYDVPTGVDTDFFRPDANTRQHENNLVFTGSMDWLPNEDAISFFVAEIMPRIKEKIPGMTLTVVGRNPSNSLLELSKFDPAVIVTGRVEDVRPYMDQAAAYIVPLRIGGGTRLKIYEAMAMEKAIVSTTIGAEGLPVDDGQELLLADSPEAFADTVVKVLTGAKVAAELGQRAAAKVRDEFGWDRVAREFSRICEEVVEENARRAA
jgi:sugar transferase (PEP-CTERM/EpsH1 system associated)